MTGAGAEAEGASIVLFDGCCRLCSGWARFVARHDRRHRLRLCPMQSPAGQRLLERLGLPRHEYATLVVLQRGRAFTRTAAVARVFRALPAPWRWLGALEVLPRRFRDGCYDLVARNRYRLFGRHAACPAPPPDLADRYLEQG